MTETAATDTAAKQPFLLVLGMHRSGTSALALALAQLGVDLPKTQMKPNQWNVTGYGESSALNELNRRILESAGSRWNDWRPLKPAWYRTKQAADLRREAHEALRQEFDLSRIFVLKDPRICRLAPFWLKVFDEARLAPLTVIPIRNPAEVAASLRARDKLEPWISYLLWLGHLLGAERATRSAPRVFTEYNALLQDWRAVVDAVGQTLHIAWSRTPQEAGGTIDALLSHERRHHQIPDEDLRDDPAAPNCLSQIYAIFSKWAAEGEDSRDHAALDRIGGDFERAGSMLSGLVARVAIAALERTIAALRDPSKPMAVRWSRSLFRRST